MADKRTLKDLLEDEIKDLYSAEKQLTKAIPKMAKGAHRAALSTAFTKHLKEPHEQVIRHHRSGKPSRTLRNGRVHDGYRFSGAHRRKQAS
jgi:hypothetical protein